MKAVWLIGFRASGKTTLGKEVARHLGWDFLDLDEEWERRNQTTILEFVADKGIDHFRKEEENLLREMDSLLSDSSLKKTGLILATGGGFVDWPASFQIVALSRHPKAYLELPAEALWERLKSSPDRRKIGDLSDFETMQLLLEKRRPFYEKIASFRLKSQAIKDCLAQLESHLAKR
ncbi:MAG TPA: shikimate kinase [Bdellovibrionota bacterium]|jgi:shikimate kinase